MGKILLITFLLLANCGQIEKTYDELNYESLTNEYCNVYFYSGGAIVGEFKNVKITYSDSDNQCLMFNYNNDTIYLQGDVIVEVLKK